MVWTHSEFVMNPLEDNAECFAEIAIVTFTAADDCGNTADTTATYAVRDRAAPVIATPSQDRTVETDTETNNAAELELFLATHGGALVAEGSEVFGQTWTHTTPVFVPVDSGTNCEDEKATITFTITDHCGNTANSTPTTFWRKDTTPPTFPFDSLDEVVEDDGDGNQAQLETWLANHGNYIAEGAHDTTGIWAHSTVAFRSVAPSVESSATCDANATIVTFYLTDNCGNTAEQAAEFLIHDTQAPIISVPPINLRVEKNDAINGDEMQAWLENHGGEY